MPASKWQREWWAACLVGLLLLQRLEDLERLLLGRETAHLGDCSRAICRANRVGNRGGRGELRQVAGSQKLRSWWWVMVVSGEPGRSRSIHGVPSAECGQYLAPLTRCSLAFYHLLAPLVEGRPRPVPPKLPAGTGTEGWRVRIEEAPSSAEIRHPSQADHQPTNNKTAASDGHR